MWKTVISFYLGYTNIKKWKLSDCKQKTRQFCLCHQVQYIRICVERVGTFSLALLPQVECLCCENMLTTLTPLKDLKDKYIR